MSYLSYLCLFVHSGVQHILCCFFVFVLCLVYPMLPFSLDYPFWIARSVLSDIYSSTNQIGTIELLVNLDFESLCTKVPLVRGSVLLTHIFTNADPVIKPYCLSNFNGRQIKYDCPKEHSG
jgi:hypothetical protein